MSTATTVPVGPTRVLAGRVKRPVPAARSRTDWAGVREAWVMNWDARRGCQDES